MGSVARGPLYLRWFTMCSERALTLRLKVDAALAVLMLSKMMCSSPCVGTANVGFFGVKEQKLNQGLSPLTFGFFLASAGFGVAIGRAEV